MAWHGGQSAKYFVNYNKCPGGGGGGCGVLPYIRYIGTCRPKGMVFEPFGLKRV